MTAEGIGTLLVGLTSLATLVSSTLTGRTARSTHTLVNAKSDRQIEVIRGQIEEIRGLKDEVMRQKTLPAEPKKDDNP